MSRHRPGARASQHSTAQILRREGRPELPPSPPLSPTVVTSGVVICISAGLLAVVLNVQRPTVPVPGSAATRPAATLPVGLPSTPATTVGWTAHVPPALPETVAVPEPPALESARVGVTVEHGTG